jgi:hypothetical protein
MDIGIDRDIDGHGNGHKQMYVNVKEIFFVVERVSSVYCTVYT